MTSISPSFSWQKPAKVQRCCCHHPAAQYCRWWKGSMTGAFVISLSWRIKEIALKRTGCTFKKVCIHRSRWNYLITWPSACLRIQFSFKCILDWIECIPLHPSRKRYCMSSAWWLCFLCFWKLGNVWEAAKKNYPELKISCSKALRTETIKITSHFSKMTAIKKRLSESFSNFEGEAASHKL